MVAQSQRQKTALSSRPSWSTQCIPTLSRYTIDLSQKTNSSLGSQKNKMEIFSSKTIYLPRWLSPRVHRTCVAKASPPLEAFLMFTSSQWLRIIWENLLFKITVTLLAHSHSRSQTSNSLGNNSGLGCNECLEILYHTALGSASGKDRVIVVVCSVPQLLRASACPEFDICHVHASLYFVAIWKYLHF